MVQSFQGGTPGSAARSWWHAPQYQYQNHQQQQQQQQRPPPPFPNLSIPYSNRQPAPGPRVPQPSQTQRPVVFISGPLEVDQTYFSTYYLPHIQRAISQGHSFLVGVSRGTDTLAFDCLHKSRVHPSRITLYFNTFEETKLRGRFRRFEEAGGAVVIVHGGYTQRDEAMTRASHYDILRYRTEEELMLRYGTKYRKRISGTQKNEMRRQQGVGLPWPGTEHLGERKEVKDLEDAKEEKGSKENETMGLEMTKEDEVDRPPPAYSEKL